jgi:hypothetical protein
MGMIVRGMQSPDSRPAGMEAGWDAFRRTQDGVGLPCFAIPQYAHARLAGALALHLKPNAFGDLPDDVVEAIRTHDIGWEEPDGAQLRRLREGRQARPAPFLTVAPAEAVPAWRRSIRHAEGISAAAGIIVSRHFCSLATDGGDEHRDFHETETQRRIALERAFSDHESLTRWFGALGFCDIVSLLLCSGADGELAIPLAHPNMPKAALAPKVHLRARGGDIRTEPAVLEMGAALAVEASFIAEPGSVESGRRFSWRVAG